MALINVDPEKQTDPFYRYKMQRVITKIEGNGNGIKTVVPNIQDIADRLARDVECLMKYFAHELAVTTKFKDGKWIMTGSFQQDTVQQSLFDFVKKFVLCKECRNPETVVQMDENKDLCLNCKACSCFSSIDPKEKLCNVLKRFAVNVNGGSSKPDKSKKDKDRSAPVAKTKDEKQEEKFQKEARLAKNEDDISEDLKEELPNPVEVLKAFMAGQGADAPPADAEIVGKIFDMKNDYGLNDKTVVALVFEALFDANISKQIESRARLFARFLKPDTELEVIINIMLLCTDEVSLKPKFAVILKKFYDHEAVSEGCILGWYDSPYKRSLSGGVDRDSVKFFKEKAKPFIEWLREDEEEDNDDDESEESGKGGDEDSSSHPSSKLSTPVTATAPTAAATAATSKNQPPAATAAKSTSTSKPADEEEVNIDDI